MSKINILIIDDDIDLASKLKNTLEENGYNVIGTAYNYKDALTLFYQLHVDLVIMDVFLGENPEGLAFAETISTVPNSIKPFVFLTASKNREIFERAKLTNPYRFLLKPFNELEVLYAIEMALEKFRKKSSPETSILQNRVTGNDYLFIKKKNVLKKVILSSIIYIKVENRYCNIVTEEEIFVIQISLAKITELLDENIFKQTHRKYIVNTNKIEKIVLKDNLLMLKGGHKIVFNGKYKDIIKSFTVLK